MTEVRVPDIGSDSADVIEILVKPGDHVSPEQAIMVLESDKASMEVPVPQGGVVRDIAVKVGDSVKLGDLLLQLDDAVATGSSDVPVREIQQELEQVKAVAKQARYEALSWARGIAKEHLVTSIGWAEGIAKEDVITSIGWAEGYGKEKEKA